MIRLKLYILGKEIVEELEIHSFLVRMSISWWALELSNSSKYFIWGCRKSIGSIISKFKPLNHSGVVPIMDYAAGIWGYCKHEKCNKVQQRALRYYLGVHSKAPLLALEGDTGWVNIETRRHTEMFRFWNRVLKMDATRLTRKVFEFDYLQSIDNRCSEIKEWFGNCNKLETFYNKNLCNEMKTCLQISG